MPELTNMNRREKLLEARKMTRKLIALTAEKIVTLTKVDMAIDQQLAIGFLPRERRSTEAEIDDLYATLHKGLTDAEDKADTILATGYPQEQPGVQVR